MSSTFSLLGVSRWPQPEWWRLTQWGTSGWGPAARASAGARSVTGGDTLTLGVTSPGVCSAQSDTAPRTSWCWRWCRERPAHTAGRSASSPTPSVPARTWIWPGELSCCLSNIMKNYLKIPSFSRQIWKSLIPNLLNVPIIPTKPTEGKKIPSKSHLDLMTKSGGTDWVWFDVMAGACRAGDQSEKWVTTNIVLSFIDNWEAEGVTWSCRWTYLYFT